MRRCSFHLHVTHFHIKLYAYWKSKRGKKGKERNNSFPLCSSWVGDWGNHILVKKRPKQYRYNYFSPIYPLFVRISLICPTKPREVVPPLLLTRQPHDAGRRASQRQEKRRTTTPSVQTQELGFKTQNAPPTLLATTSACLLSGSKYFQWYRYRYRYLPVSIIIAAATS